MTLRLIAPPTDLPVTVAEAKSNMKVEVSEDDALIEWLIRAALAHAERWCGHAFMAQTWEQVLDAFPAAEIDLGIGPVVSVVSVKYDDVDGFEQTVSSSDYELDDVSVPGWVMPVVGAPWPATLDSINSVRVRFITGASPVPSDVRQAVLLMVGHWYAHREDAVVDDVRSIPMGAQALLSLHRRMYV